MVKVGMTLRQCVDHANLMPTMGTLKQVSEAKALRFKFIDRFSPAEMERFGITKDERTGRYFVDDANAPKGVDVTLEDNEVKYFQNFIDTLDALKMVSIGNVDLYNKVKGIVVEEEVKADAGADETQQPADEGVMNGYE